MSFHLPLIECAFDVKEEVAQVAFEKNTIEIANSIAEELLRGTSTCLTIQNTINSHQPTINSHRPTINPHQPTDDVINAIQDLVLVKKAEAAIKVAEEAAERIQGIKGYLKML